MDEDQLDRLQHLFLTVLELPEEQRESWLKDQCGNDKTLLDEIRSLLQYDSPRDDPLEKPLDQAIDLDRTVNSRPTEVQEPQLTSGDQFLSRLAQVDILSSDEINEIEREIAEGDPSSNPRQLASQLVTSGKLTAYQAESLLKGHPCLLIDKYLILDLIDTGGMGTVFKAIHRQMNRVVAIKMISKQLLTSSAQVQRFLREVRVAATLEDLNVVRAYDADQFNGTHFLVMEYVRGENLTKRVGRDGPLSVEDATNCILQAARGLRYAHRRGVVHRDIKPSNLMQAEDGTVKVLDLGLANIDDSNRLLKQNANTCKARQDKSEHSDSSITQAGDLLGTASFMAPEQSRDAGLADPRSDVYGLGCTFYFLLMGEPPYPSESVTEVLARHRESAVPSVRDQRPDVPPAIDAICSKMLAKEPGQRFQSMGELIAAIEDSEIDLPKPGEHPPHQDSRSSGERGVKMLTPDQIASRRSWSPHRVLGAGTVLATLIGLVIAGHALSVAPSSDERRSPDSAALESSNPPVSTRSLYLNRETMTDAELAFRLAGAAGLKELHLYDTSIGDDSLASVGRCLDLEDLWLGRTAVTSKGLSQLRQLANLQRLGLEHTIVDDQCFEHLEPLKTLSWLNLECTSITDEITAPLGKIERVKWLNLGHTEVTDQGIANLTGLVSLGALLLHGTQVTDEGVRAIASLQNLTHLDLGQTRVTDAGLANLKTLSKLRKLHLGSPSGLESHHDSSIKSNSITTVDGSGLSHLSGLVRLEKLCLGDSLVDDAGLARLPTLRRLEELHLSRTLVTDAGLVHLAKQKNLRVLHLSGTQVTDEGLAQLRLCQKLRALWVYDTRVTRAGIDVFLNALPHCEVRTNTEAAIRHDMRFDRKGTPIVSRKTLDQLGGQSELEELEVVAKLAADRQDWDDARQAYRRMVDMDSTDASSWQELMENTWWDAWINGRSLDDAMAIHREASEALGEGPGGLDVDVCQAAWCLLSDQRQEYERVCRDVLQRYEHADRPRMKFQVAKIVAFGEQPIAPPEQIVELAREAIAEEPETEYFREVLALSLIRAGRFEEALKTFRTNSALTALAHARMGNASEARRWLNRARVTISGNPLDPRSTWYPDHRLAWRLYLRETERLLAER